MQELDESLDSDNLVDEGWRLFEQECHQIRLIESLNELKDHLPATLYAQVKDALYRNLGLSVLETPERLEERQFVHSMWISRDVPEFREALVIIVSIGPIWRTTVRFDKALNETFWLDEWECKERQGQPYQPEPFPPPAVLRHFAGISDEAHEYVRTRGF